MRRGLLAVLAPAGRHAGGFEGPAATRALGLLPLPVGAAAARGLGTAAEPAAAPPAPRDDAQRQLVALLRAGIEFEARAGHANARGTSQRFDAFVAARLAELRAAAPAYAPLLAPLAGGAARYAALAPGARAELLAAVKTVLASMEEAARPAGAAAAEPPAEAAAAPAAAAPLDLNSPPAPPPAAATGDAGTAAAAPAELPPHLDADGLWTVTAASLEAQLAAEFAPPPPSAVARLVPIVIDLETSGPFPPTALVIELAALAPDSGAAFQAHVRLPAGAAMDAGATRVNGVTTAAARDARRARFADAYAAFLEFVEAQARAAGAGAVPLLVGHNVRGFDLPVLLRRAREAGLPLPLGARLLDTLVLARLVHPPAPAGAQAAPARTPANHKLQTLHAHYFGAEAPGAHSAAADCAAAAAVLAALAGARGWAGRPLAEALAADRRFALAQRHEWVGHLPVVAGGGAGRGAAARRAASAFTSRAEFGAGVAVAEGEAAVLATAADPLAAVEAEAADEDAGEEEEEAEELALLLRPPGSACFLDTPLAEVKVGGVKFTAPQVEAARSAGLLTLRHVLENFPRGYSSAAPGALPDEAAAAAAGGAAQAVCLLVRRTSLKTFSTGSGHMLAATFEPVHPAAAGLPTALPPDAYAGRSPVLRLSVWRPGGGRARFGAYAVQQARAELERFAEGEPFVLSATVAPLPADRYGGGPDVWEVKATPKYEVAPAAGEAAAAFAPGAAPRVGLVYAAAGGLTPRGAADGAAKALRALAAAEARGGWADPLPAWARSRHGLAGYAEAVAAMHAPPSEEAFERARRRLAFQELLALQLGLLLRRAALRGGAGAGAAAPRVDDLALMHLGERALGFELTRAQRRALDALVGEMAGGGPPMLCLLQGDVGCGKTAVALLAALAAAGSGAQAAIMAPTEVLAEQHFAGLSRLLAAMEALQQQQAAAGGGGAAGGGAPPRVPRAALLTGGTPAAARAPLLAGLADGSLGVVVGTHALVSGPVAFRRLGLAVVDEQHKFGVAQRAALLAKARPAPHMLAMSATPIPRSLALAAHGECALVTIDELPPGRSPVDTRVVLDSPDARRALYKAVRAEVAAGGRVFIVCPLVEKAAGAAAGGERLLRAAVDERERLAAGGALGDAAVGLLHGRMRPDEKDAALAAFRSGETPVLIATTVVEVGVDVPAASMMVVEHAERFGLAQLHQLRGRVGRGARASRCLLVTDAAGGAAERLRALERHASGFEVAEEDFRLRGAGELLGRRQAGKPGGGGLRLARLPGDLPLLEAAREAAAQHVAMRGADPARWPRELAALVAAQGAADLDLAAMPSAEALAAG